MTVKFIEYIIHCGFCGIETGKLELPEYVWGDQVLTNELLGIDDSRCASCEAIHGKFINNVVQ